MIGLIYHIRPYISLFLSALRAKLRNDSFRGVTEQHKMLLSQVGYTAVSIVSWRFFTTFHYLPILRLETIFKGNAVRSKLSKFNVLSEFCDFCQIPFGFEA